MESQKSQHKLRKYTVLGLLSFGSTSNVFKIVQIPKQKQCPHLKQQNLKQSDQNEKEFRKNSQEKENKFEIIEISMKEKKNSQKMSQSVQIDLPVNLTVQSQKYMVLKLYNLEKMLKKTNQFLQQVKYDILVEVILLTYLNHPGIIKAKQLILQYQKFIDENKQKKKLIKAGIVMQMCQKGCFNSLINYINRTKVLKQNKNKILKFYFSQIATTLMYLNLDLKILHRDLKAENIMITKQLKIKIIDFGVSKITLKQIKEFYTHPHKKTLLNLFGFNQEISVEQLFAQIQNQQRKRKNLVGSKHYISPQLVQKYKSDMELIDQAYQKTDIWSFGILLYKIYHQKYPFQGKNNRQTLQFIQNEQLLPEIDKKLPGEVQQIIKKCLIKDYEHRISWKQMINLNYFKEFPLNIVNDSQSPITQLLFQNKKKNKQFAQNIQDIIFDEFVILKYQNDIKRRRRLLIVKQKQNPFKKIIVLKQKSSISLQFQLKVRQNLKVQKDQDIFILNFRRSQNNQSFKIQIEAQRQIVQKLIGQIKQAYN